MMAQHNNLLPGWQLIPLEQVCTITMGQSPEGTSYNAAGRGEPLLNGPTEFGPVHPTPIQWTTAPTRFAEPGDILLCVRGATTGRKNMADRRYCIGRGLAAVRGKPELADTGFLWFALDLVTSQLLAQASGSTFPNLPGDKLAAARIPLPAIAEQRRIARNLAEQMATIDRARAAAEAQLALMETLVESFLRESLGTDGARNVNLAACLREVTEGVGDNWSEYPVLGATREGLAPAKEQVGKSPGRYKLVNAGTIFYNPMRILLGSIAFVDDGDTPGITSPDYVVFKTTPGFVHPRWFYHWLRSCYGAAFIKTLARGAVRERMLFRRLAAAEVTIPPWDAQVRTAEKLAAIARVRNALSNQLGDIDRLPAALLRRAFCGEL